METKMNMESKSLLCQNKVMLQSTIVIFANKKSEQKLHVI